MNERCTIIQEELPGIIRLLREPAGNDPRFATSASIRNHRTDFLTRAHDTWKQLHNRSLDELLKIEVILRPPEANGLSPGFSWFLHYCMAIWRRVNDALVWSVLGYQGHHIRRLCHGKDRPALSHANPVSMRRFLDDLNSDPLTFALWADATSCVDVGDVVSRSFSGKPSGIFEVKEGRVNERILDLIASGGDIETKVQQIDSLARDHGEKGVKQLQRAAKQMQVLNSVLDILESDEGFDPHLKSYVVVREAQTPDESYDDQLAEMIEHSTGAPVLECIDRCLWVYIDRDPANTLAERTRAFTAALFQRSPSVRHWNMDRHQSHTLVNVVPLDANLFEPIAIPLLCGRYSQIPSGTSSSVA